MLFITRTFTIALFFIFFIFSFIYSDINLLFISLLFIYISCILYTLKNYEEKIILLFFLISFFVFLIGSYTYEFFNDDYWWNQFSEITVRNTIIYLISALISIILGFRITVFLNRKVKFTNHSNKKDHSIKRDSTFNKKIRSISKVVFYITLIPTTYLLFQEISFSRDIGYIESYLRNEGGSVILNRLQYVNLISLYMYLSTMPTKKDSKLIILIYLIFSALTLLGGARGTAIVSLLIILFYCFYRNKYDRNLTDGEVWIKKKSIFLMVILSPLVIIFLSFWGYYRVNETLVNIKLTDLFFTFFKDQGGSVNIISYAQELDFPSSNISYTFGPIIYFLKYNIITQLFFDFPQYMPHTPDMALYGNNLAHTITYLVMPYNYFAGIGMGSNYIAELLIDFGFVGVIIFNLFLGFLLFIINNLSLNKPWLFTISLLMLNSIFLLPRSSALNWLTDIFNITTIGSILIFYFFAKLGERRSTLKNSNINT